MSLETYVQDNRYEAFAEGEVAGEANATLRLIKNLMHNNHCSIDDAMNALGILSEERQQYKELLSKK